VEENGGVRHMLSRLVSYFVRTPLIWLYTVFLGTVSLICSFFDRSGEMQHNIARLWSRMILLTASSPVTVQGLEKIDTTKAHVYVSNHLSALDIPVLYTNLPFQFRILAKKELFRYPFMGWHLKRSGQIPVVLENPKASIRSLHQAVIAIKNNMPLVIFPEGSRSETGHLQPFMGGAFFAAIKAQVDVVPVVLVGTYEVLKMNSFHMKPRPLMLIIADPIPTTGLTSRDVEAVSQKARAAMADIYYRYSPLGNPVRESK